MLQTAEILQSATGNRTVKLFVNLNRSRTFREKNRAFAMEGGRLILDALSSGVRLRALLWTEKAREQYGREIPSAQMPQQTLLISDALAKEIADTETAQGIFAIAEMLPEKAELPAHGTRNMLLHCVQDPSNLVAILRTAEALGTDGLYLFQCCDLYNPKTIRSSMGALFRLPLMRLTDMDAFFAHCRAVSLPTCAAVVDRNAELLGGYDFCRGAVVLIGNEGNGLPREISAACEKRLTIPMSPASNSLNAAMAAGLFLWEMAKS
jgi:TrmH family RNA methyltransferase